MLMGLESTRAQNCGQLDDLMQNPRTGTWRGCGWHPNLQPKWQDVIRLMRQCWRELCEQELSSRGRWTNDPVMQASSWGQNCFPDPRRWVETPFATTQEHRASSYANVNGAYFHAINMNSQSSRNTFFRLLMHIALHIVSQSVAICIPRSICVCIPSQCDQALLCRSVAPSLIGPPSGIQ